MQVAARLIGKSLEEFPRQSKPEGARHVLPLFGGADVLILHFIQTTPNKAGSAAEIDDAARLKQFQGDSSFVTWMTRIVINLCLDQLRKQKRQRAESIEHLDEELGGVERQMPVITVNPTEGLERSELRARIDRALNLLSHEHRTVLILHEFEDLEYKEIAKRMECSIGTVMSRLFYARRKMATLMASYKREEMG